MMEWTEVLANECEKTSRRYISTRLGISPTTLSQVLSGTYNGNLERIRKRVEGLLMKTKIDCPVIGDIPLDQCIKHQGRANKFAATNPLRVLLHQTCPTCPNRIGGKSK